MRPVTFSLVMLALLTGSGAQADPVVVVPARPGMDRLSHEEVTNIFMGRLRALPSGAPALPIDQPKDSTLRTSFYQRLVNKDGASINAYWSRLYFSGKATPPLQVVSEAQVIQQLLTRPGAIAYVERSQVDARMRIVFEFPP